MKRASYIVILTLFLSAYSLAPGLWTTDPAHSQLQFTVQHLGINDVSGVFRDFSGTITPSQSDFSDAVIEMTAKTGSLDTYVEARNNHLKSADFFEVEKYPEMTFRSTSIAPAEHGLFKVNGNLSLHGVTQPVSFYLVYRGETINQMNKKATKGFQVIGTLSRSDFGIGPKFPASIISDIVRFKGDVECVLGE